MGTDASALVWQPFLIHLPLVVALILPIVIHNAWRLSVLSKLESRLTWMLPFRMVQVLLIAMLLSRQAVSETFRRIAPLISDDALVALDIWEDHLGFKFPIAVIVVQALGILMFAVRTKPKTGLAYLFLSLALAGYALFLAHLSGELWFIHRVMEVGL